MTHLKAKALFSAGKVNDAWIVAQQDDGWTGDVNFDGWCKWMQSLAVA